MTTQQQIEVPPRAAKPGRDPQNFTPGDRLAWKIVGYAFGAITVVGTATAVLVFVTLSGS